MALSFGSDMRYMQVTLASAGAPHRSRSAQNNGLFWDTPDVWQVKNILNHWAQPFHVGRPWTPQEESRGAVVANSVGSPLELGEGLEYLKFATRTGKVC